MRISDWSSDVCSSDVLALRIIRGHLLHPRVMVREQSMMIAEEFRCASAAGEKRGSQVIAITHRIAAFHIVCACAHHVDLKRGGGIHGNLCAMPSGLAVIFDKGGPRGGLPH